MQVKTNFELDRYADLLDCMDAITLEVRACMRACPSINAYTLAQRGAWTMISMTGTQCCSCSVQGPDALVCRQGQAP